MEEYRRLCRRENNDKMDLKELRIGVAVRSCIDSVQDKD